MSSNFCPRSRLSFWSREEGSAFPPRVGSSILDARAESGAYSRAPLLLPAFRDRDGAAAVCLPLPLVRTVWLVGLAEVAPPTPSNALLVDQIRSHELRSTSACSPSRSLTLSSLPQGLVLPRPGSSRGGRLTSISINSGEGDNTLLKPTGIQIATKPLAGPTNREHWKPIGVKTTSSGTNYGFNCLECCQYFIISESELLLRATVQRRLSDSLPYSSAASCDF